MRDTPDRFPALFAPTVWPWGPTHVRFELRSELPPSELIANVNLVGRVGSDWLMIDVSGEGWDLPGGALEPGEPMLDALRRELIEEAGATLESFSAFGAWHCRSLAAGPYRPHQPHPESFRVVGLGSVSLDRAPLNPSGAEQVRAVETVSLEEAIGRFTDRGRPDLADLYRLAAELAPTTDEIVS